MRVKLAVIGVCQDKYRDFSLADALKKIKESEDVGIKNWARFEENEDFDAVIGSDVLSGEEALGLFRKIDKFYSDQQLDSLYSIAFINVDNEEELVAEDIIKETHPEFFKALAKRDWSFHRLSIPVNFYETGWLYMEVDIKGEHVENGVRVNPPDPEEYVKAGRLRYKVVKAEHHGPPDHDGAFLILCGGNKYYYLDRQRHRTDGPAVIGADGYQAYYQHGSLYRAKGPNVICPDGTRVYYSRDGKLIKKKLPDGSGLYYQDGDLIKKKLPDGSKLYYQGGKLIKKKYPDGTRLYYRDEWLIRKKYPDGTRDYYQDGDLIQTTSPKEKANEAESP